MATKKDFTQVAHDVFQQAVGEAPKPVKKLAGRKGGLKGGKARMGSLTAEQKHELAMRGVAARKAPAVPRAGGVKVTKADR